MHPELILGTVQFGLDYGISNRSGKVSKDEVNLILAFALMHGVETLDTARLYGESESVLGECLHETGAPFRIITKFGANAEPEASLRESLNALQVPKVNALLVHHFSDLKSDPKIWEKLQMLKRTGSIHKAGVSLYHPEEWDWMRKQKMIPDLVQIPFSIFDRRFDQAISELKDFGVEIHIRSIFLQGLIFYPPENLPAFFAPVKSVFQSLHSKAKCWNTNVLSLCMRFVWEDLRLDGVVIGVEGLSSFQENVFAWNRLKTQEFSGIDWDSFIIRDEKFLLPVNWLK